MFNAYYNMKITTNPVQKKKKSLSQQTTPGFPVTWSKTKDIL